MADSDKNILITPNKSGANKPNIVLTGKGVIPITLNVNNDTDGTLTFEGSSGVLFSLDNNLSYGKIFSVNDASALPLFDVDADGTVRLNPYGTTIYVGGISGDAVIIRPATRSSTGAGADITIAAGSGVTAGGGGSVILQPGAQATGGGNGRVIVRGLSGSTANLQEWQNNAGTVLSYVAANGVPAAYGGGQIVSNTAFGVNALGSNTTQTGNTAFGAGALGNTSTASSVTAVGYNAGYGSSGSEGVVIGSATLGSGNRNVVVGSYASASTSGSNNVSVGAVACYLMTSGSRNVGIGYYALYGVTTTGENVAVGADAGRYSLPFDYGSAVGMSNSVYIGSYAYANSNETNAIAIGYGAASKGSNNTVIGNTSTTTATIFGETHYIGGVAGTAISIQPQTRSTTGAGANVTIAAGAGVTTGAGGSIILQPGAQATSGGNGVVVVRQPGGTAGTDEAQISHSGTYLTIQNKDGGGTGSGIYITETSGYGIYVYRDTGLSIINAATGTLTLAYQSSVNLSFWSVNGGTGAFYTFSDAYPLYWPGSGLKSNIGAILSVTGGSTSGTSTGGSLAFTNSSPGSYSANQTDLALTGSAFQRLSCNPAVSIFSIAPPSGGSHVDGRMIRIYNVGTFNLTLKHNYTTGTTQANRMFCVQSADIVIATNDFAELIYDGTNNGSGAAGWRVA